MKIQASPYSVALALGLVACAEPRTSAFGPSAVQQRDGAAAASNAMPPDANVLNARVRPSAIAGSWYPERRALAMLAAERLMQVASTAPSVPAKPLLLVVPHAGWSLSGVAAAAAYRSFGRHGILFELGHRRALFLPQVPSEQGWTLEQTLAALARKAGLSSEAWRASGARRRCRCRRRRCSRRRPVQWDHTAGSSAVFANFVGCAARPAGGIQLAAKNGEDNEYASLYGDWTNLTELSDAGDWVEITLDLTGVTTTPPDFDPTAVSILSIQVLGGDEWDEAVWGTTTVYIDSVTFSDGAYAAHG